MASRSGATSLLIGGCGIFFDFSRKGMEEVRKILAITKKLAGEFHAPPLMVRDIVTWTEAKIAAFELAGSKRVIEYNSKVIDAEQEILQRRLRERDRVNYLMGQTNQDDVVKQAEHWLQRKTRMYLDGEIERAEKSIAHRRKRIKEEQEAAIKHSEVLAGSSHKVKISSWKRAKKRVKLNLAGWKYLGRAKQGEQWRLAIAVFGTIDVELVNSGKLRGGGSAYWDGHRHLIRIRVGKSMSDKLRTTIRHEVQHFAQDFLGMAVKAIDVGMPSKKIRTPEINQWLKANSSYSSEKELVRKLRSQGITPDGFHALDDIEFYTRLSDSVDEFKESWSSPRNPLNRYDFKERFKIFIGEIEMPRYLMKELNLIGGSKTFWWFKNHAKGKWKKAVKELWKAVS